MRFNVTRTSAFDEIINTPEINTLDELLAFIKQADNEVIVIYDKNNDQWTLEIYDDYRE